MLFRQGSTTRIKTVIVDDTFSPPVPVIASSVFGVVLAAVGWWCREIWDSVKRLKEDIQKIEVDLPTNYVKKIQ